jgi:predicted O-methyltransferase YrrM
MQVGPLEGALLSLLTKVSGATRVLEIGTFTGCSSIHFVRALPFRGLVTTLDRDPRALEIARTFWKKAGVESRIESIPGDAKFTLKNLRAELASGVRESYDLAFIDADKGGYEEYFEACLGLVRPGGLILVDNLLWEGRVLSPETKQDHAIVRFNENRRADLRVERVLLPIRDGIGIYRLIPIHSHPDSP